MSSPSTPKPLHSSRYPIGWDFEDMKVGTTPVSETLWFVPWENTEYCGLQKIDPFNKDRLLFFSEKIVKQEHEGTSIVIDENSGKIVGCYKTHADTDDGEVTKTQIQELEHSQHRNVIIHNELLQVPEEQRTKKHAAQISKAQRYMDDFPNDIRRLNGLRLDPQPWRIAHHFQGDQPVEAYKIHPAMSGQMFKKYGAQYRYLEYRIRKAMGDTFIEDLGLPLYRQNNIMVAENASDSKINLSESDSD
ncbi:hypothetical protein N0V90_012316 [Kalmusia sp. IMI 367209]|nr:hypothetical protein N0V90_012316 [Kalmusia sp. IMI 367209]